MGRVISECVIGTAELTNLDDFFPSLNCFVFPGEKNIRNKNTRGIWNKQQEFLHEGYR
jgi:hypothetical protein